MNFIHQPIKTCSIDCPLKFHELEVHPDEIQIRVAAEDYLELEEGDYLYGVLPLTSSNLDILIDSLLKIRNKRIIKREYP